MVTMTQAENIYINGCIIGTLIIYQVTPYITACAPFEGIMIFSLANWLPIQKKEEERPIISIK